MIIVAILPGIRPYKLLTTLLCSPQDITPVTNLQYLEYLASSSYRPADEQNWLNDWDGEEPVPGYPELGMYPEGWGDKPVSDSQPTELRTSRPATRT